MHAFSFLVLSARQWWCEPGEPLLWTYVDPFRTTLFKVKRLDSHGRPRRVLPVRAAMRAGATCTRVAEFLTTGESYDEHVQPSAIIEGRHRECLAVRMTGVTPGQGTVGKQPSVIVATPNKIASLGVAEEDQEKDHQPESNPGWVRAVKQVGQKTWRLAEDYAGQFFSHSNARTVTPNAGRTPVPRVRELAAIEANQIARFDMCRETFGLSYEEEDRSGSYLWLTFADRSRLGLTVPEEGPRIRALLEDRA